MFNLKNYIILKLGKLSNIVNTLNFKIKWKITEGSK